MFLVTKATMRTERARDSPARRIEMRERVTVCFRLGMIIIVIKLDIEGNKTFHSWRKVSKELRIERAGCDFRGTVCKQS